MTLTLFEIFKERYNTKVTFYSIPDELFKEIQLCLDGKSMLSLICTCKILTHIKMNHICLPKLLFRGYYGKLFTNNKNNKDQKYLTKENAINEIKLISDTYNKIDYIYDLIDIMDDIIIKKNKKEYRYR